MARQSIMDTYKELMSVKNDSRWPSAQPKEVAKKLYWVATDPVTGIMKVSSDFHDILGHSLDNVREVFAHNSEAARCEYNALRP
jgi:hypothetical protein